MNVYLVPINANHVIPQQLAIIAREIGLIILFVIVLMAIMKMKYPSIVQFALEIVPLVIKTFVSLVKEIEF